MKYMLIFVTLFMSAPVLGQQRSPDITGTWKALSKIETETTAGAVTGTDKEIYKAGEKTYMFTSTTVTITQGFGKHKEKLPIRLQGNRLFIGKAERNKQPYILALKDGQLRMTKTERKVKKQKVEVEVEVVTLVK